MFSFNRFLEAGKSAQVWLLVNGPKLAVLKNVCVLKLEQGKWNEFAFLAYKITGYGYIGLCVVSASVRVISTGDGAFEMWHIGDGGTFTASYFMLTSNILNIKQYSHSIEQFAGFQFTSESPWAICKVQI